MGLRDRAFGRVRLNLARIARSTPGVRGKERILRSIDATLRRLSEESRVIDAVAGVRFSLDTRDLIDFRLAFAGAHDADVLHAVVGLAGRGAVFWDVGCNVGAISLLLASQRPDLSIEAFEPSPSVRRRLATNLDLNPSLAPRIRVHPLALSAATGHAVFYESAEAENSGVGSLGRMHNTSNQGVETECLRGDDLITSGRARRPDILKIDVEGYEAEVLVGLGSLLRGPDAPIVIVEHEPYRLRERRLDADAVCRTLIEYGYQVSWLSEHGQSLPLLRRSLDERGDMLCVPARVAAVS